MNRMMLLFAVAAAVYVDNPGPNFTDGATPVPPDPPFPEEVQVLLRKLDDPAPAARLKAGQ